MTVLEQVYEFGQLLETVDPSFKVESKPDTDSILIALNIGQTRYIYDKYLSKSTMAENVEYLQKRSDDLKNIIKRNMFRAIPVSTGSLTDIAYTVALPTDYLFYLRSDSHVLRTGSVLNTSGSYVWAPNEVARSFEHVAQVTTNLFNKGILRQPVVTLESTGFVVIVDSYTDIEYDAGISNLYGFDLTYLRKPLYLGLVAVTDKTVTTCELAEHTHEEIVRYAVDIYLKEYKFMLAKGASGEKQTPNN